MSVKIIQCKSEITLQALPLFAEQVPAGFPSPAQGFEEARLDLNELCVTRPAATFFVRAAGTSMVDVGIYPGDVLVVDRSLEAKHGDVVIAAVDGELTVKELCLHPAPRLIARSQDHPDVELPEEATLELMGVVTFSLHSLRG